MTKRQLKKICVLYAHKWWKPISENVSAWTPPAKWNTRKIFKFCFEEKMIGKIYWYKIQVPDSENIIYQSSVKRGL